MAFDSKGMQRRELGGPDAFGVYRRVFVKGELWCKNTNFAKERPNIIATNFPILVTPSYKLRATCCKDHL